MTLSATNIVITLDRKPPWDRALGNPGLILWPDLETALRQGETLPDALRARSGAA